MIRFLFCICLFMVNNTSAFNQFYMGIGPSYTQNKIKTTTGGSLTVDKIGPVNENTEDQFIRADLVNNHKKSKNKLNFVLLLGGRSNLNSKIFFDVDVSVQTGGEKLHLGEFENIFTAAVDDVTDTLVGADEENVSIYLKKGVAYGFGLRGGVSVWEDLKLFLGLKTSVQLGRVYTVGSFVDDDDGNTHSVNQSASYTAIAFTPEIMVEKNLGENIAATATLGYRNAVRKSVSGRISGLSLADRGLAFQVSLRYYL
jgi:hypothetical protein